MRTCLALASALVIAAPAAAQDPAPSLQAQVEQVFASAPEGTRFGLLVVDDGGKTLVRRDYGEGAVPEAMRYSRCA